MSRHAHYRQESRPPSVLFESLEPREMLAGDFAVAWNGSFINPAPGADFGLHLTPGTPATPPDVNVGDRLLTAKNKTTVRPLLNIGNVGTGRIYGYLYFDYYLRPAAVADNSQDVLLYHNLARGGLNDDSKFVSGKHKNQVDIKNLVLQIPYNTPAGDYVLVAVISKTYATPDGLYKKNAIPNGDGDGIAGNNIAVSAPFKVLTPVYNLTSSIREIAFDDSISTSRVTRGQILVNVTNAQGTAATAPTGKTVAGGGIDISVFLRPIGAVDDSQDISIGTLKKAGVGNLNIGKSRGFVVNLKTPKTLAAGQYKIVAVVDKLIPVDGKPSAFSALSGKLTEIEDSNADNTSISSETISAS